MTWIATDDFDGYSTGVSIDTLNGGSGWSGAWSKVIGDAGELTIETAPAGGQGGNAAKVNNATTTNEEQAQRSFTAITQGSVRCRMRVAATPATEECGISLGDAGGSGSYMYVGFSAAGNIVIYNHDTTSYETIQAFSADTWYTLDVEFDNTGQPNKYRARIDEGSWTAWKTVNTGSYTNINRFKIASGNNFGVVFWVDDIGPTPAEGPPPPTLSVLSTGRRRRYWVSDVPPR